MARNQIQGKNGNILEPNSDGSVNVSQKGSIATEPFSGFSSTTKTFSEEMNGFAISNDGDSDLTFTINTDEFTVKSGEYLEQKFESFTQVTVTTSVAFRAWGLK